MKRNISVIFLVIIFFVVFSAFADEESGEKTQSRGNLSEKLRFGNNPLKGKNFKSKLPRLTLGNPATSTNKSKEKEPSRITALPVSINAEVNPKKIKLGEKATVSVFVVHDKETKIQMAGVPESHDYDVEVKGTHSQPTSADNNKTITTIKYDVQVFSFDDDGKAKLPPAVIIVRNEGIEPEKLISPTPEVELDLQFPKEKGATAELDDVAKLKDLFRANYTLLYILIGLFFAALLFGVFYILKRFYGERETKEDEIVEVIPADVIAMQKLKAIIAKEYLKSGEIDKYYEEISEVIREFFGNLYEFDSVEMTSEELLNKLSSFPTPGLDIKMLKKFLHHTDLVKFSEIEPTREQCSQVLDDAYYFIKSTHNIKSISKY